MLNDQNASHHFSCLITLNRVLWILVLQNGSFFVLTCKSLSIDFTKHLNHRRLEKKAVKNIKNITGKVSGCALIFGK